MIVIVYVIVIAFVIVDVLVLVLVNALIQPRSGFRVRSRRADSGRQVCWILSPPYTRGLPDRLHQAEVECEQ